MRTFLVVFALVVVVGVSSAYPSNPVEVEVEDFDDQVPDLQTFQDTFYEEPQIHSRQKRATCDLLSAFGVGHAACAAHCIGHGYRGGYCNSKAVCTCRR
ncbi:defensin [Phlebotomus papatasi]|uniref:defensin n=1 Tax=Phlebotomus papatasi TaxID=29031 RepID=UPI0024838778|nr:defensin [Phlebotomus papatasi]